MPFNTEVRNKLASMVGNARKLLRKEFQEQLQEIYGIQPDGRILPIEKLTHLNDEQLAIAALLRQGIEYLKSSETYKKNPIQAAIERFLHEQSFTVLNRFAALRLCEDRGIIQECLKEGTQPKGFQVYLKIAGSGIGNTFLRYKTFLLCLFDEIAVDLGVLFDRFSREGLLFPREQALLKLLELINRKELDEIWLEDETIGWIYQYFNSQEERKKMRKASSAPRNSHELAVRNQFFTPRYIVQFLTDNTLGRIWYEMKRGETCLVEECEYFMRQANEIFLKEDEMPPEQGSDTEDLSQEEVLKQHVYIPYREKKDPRDLKILDPACGSGHFLLYAYNLLETIYEEAWDDSDLGESLLQDFKSLENFRKAIPGLILEHNLFGIDIDKRCAQIGSLALWLRAQRAYKKLSLRPSKRPKIKKTNIVIAEPMPGNKELLKEFIVKLESPAIAKLVEIVFNRMQLTGEAGFLLRIEEEIRSAIFEAKALWRQSSKTEQLKLFAYTKLKPEQTELSFDFSGITDELFWEKTEERIYAVLRDYAEQAETGNYQRHMFAEHSVQGFAFIDLCRKRYDVVVMNPPFGEASKSLISELKTRYPVWNKNILCAFIERALENLSPFGVLATVIDRSLINKSSYKKFRSCVMLEKDSLELIADLGWGVLEANVEVSTLILSDPLSKTALTFCFDVRNENIELKEKTLRNDINLSQTERFHILHTKLFNSLPNAAIIYDLPSKLLSSFTYQSNLSEARFCSYTGHQLQAERHFRVFWEISQQEQLGPNENFCHMYNGGGFSRYLLPPRDVARFGAYSQIGSENFPSYSYRIQNKDKHFLEGIGFGERGEILDAHLVPLHMLFTVEGQVCPLNDRREQLILLGILNSSAASRILNTYAGQHKYSGYVNLLPIPHLTETDKSLIEKNVMFIILEKAKFYSYDETCISYRQPIWVLLDANNFSLTKLGKHLNRRLSEVIQGLIEHHDSIETIINRAYAGKSPEALEDLEKYRAHTPKEIIAEWDYRNELDCRIFATETVISFVLGSAFGRWNIRYPSGEKEPPELIDPFNPLPVCPPGMLQNNAKLPATPEDVPTDYPLRISWAGILVDDPNHQEDIVHRVREALTIIWKDQADVIEQEACQILKIKSIRDYFRNPNKFFASHLKRYSKSRRQAPVYWPISTKSGSYTLWIYYQRLTNQTLFSCVTEFIDPKLNDLSKEIENLKKHQEREGAKKQFVELEKLQDFKQELFDFRNELLRITDLPYEPNLNDGVIITACPLLRLFRHKKWSEDLKACWDKLKVGEYDWAHLALSIWPERVKEKCKTDKSLRITHVLENLYERTQ